MPKIKNLEELEDFAKNLIQYLKPGDILALRGQMGAGKTTLVRACMRHWGFQEPVVSPTYPIVVEYEWEDPSTSADRPSLVIHIDGFRLQEGQPLPFDPGDWKARGAIVFIEWPERLGLNELIHKTLDIEVLETGERLIDWGKLDKPLTLQY